MKKRKRPNDNSSFVKIIVRAFSAEKIGAVLRQENGPIWYLQRNSLDGAGADAGAAIDAGAFVDAGLAVNHRDRADGARAFASAAAHAHILINLRCHVRNTSLVFLKP